MTIYVIIFLTKLASRPSSLLISVLNDTEAQIFDVSPLKLHSVKVHGSFPAYMTAEVTTSPLSSALINIAWILAPYQPQDTLHIHAERPCAVMTHLGMCCRWNSAGSSYIPPLGFRCPYRCTMARRSSWSSCYRHSWESSLSLWGQPHIKTH